MKVELFAVLGLPLVKMGDDLAKMITDRIPVREGDVIVIAQKVISKAEGAIVRLANIVPGKYALELAEQTGRDPRLCQVYLDEATEVIKVKGRMIITRHKLGFVGSSSFVDKSNVAPYGDELVVLLPIDPDRSAQIIRSNILKETGKCVAVIINDSLGRDDRDGSVGMAIGIAGIAALEKESRNDLFGNPSSPSIDRVDELAAAASLLMGQTDEAVPTVVIRGARYTKDERARISDLLV